MKLDSKGVPYWERPDLAISADDVKAIGRNLLVTVHNIGSVDAPETDIALRDAGGASIAAATVPALKAPVDLIAKTVEVTVKIPEGKNLDGCSVVIDPSGKLTEITLRNNESTVSAKNQ
jgi:hypothetical protein